MPASRVFADSARVADLDHPLVEQQVSALRRSQGERLAPIFALHSDLGRALPRQFRGRRQLAADHGNHVLGAILRRDRAR